MYKLLVLIPYRDRKDHLNIIIPFLHNKLKTQNIEYKIIVIEQYDNKLFNRGLLCNVGFSLYMDWCDYVCIHDVDMICDNGDYSYSDDVVSLVSSRTKNSKIYDNYLGGITLFPKNSFLIINGFSNKYWGWGGEDDDLYERCKLYKLNIIRRNGLCEDLELTEESINRANNFNYKNNCLLLKQIKTISTVNNDGLSNINTYYTLHKILETKLFIILQVDLVCDDIVNTKIL